jgi:hypothetical protein
MAITEIVFLRADPSIDIHAPGNPAGDALHKIYPFVKKYKGFLHLAPGRHIFPDKSIVQDTAEWEEMQDHIDFMNSTEFPEFYKMVTAPLGEPRRMFHIALNRSLFESGGPATSKVTEFVELYFPASQVTTAFQEAFAEKWSAFEEIYTEGSKAVESVASGWVFEEQDYAKVKDGKAKSFVVVRGWDSMEQYETAQKTERFEKAFGMMLDLHGEHEKVSLRV